MTTIKITVNDVVVEVEPAGPRTFTEHVFNIGSPQAAVQRIEEAQRRAAKHATPAGPHRKVLDEYMRVFDAQPANPGRADVMLDPRTGAAFGLNRSEFNQYAAGLANALGIAHSSACSVLDGLALVTGGAS